METLAIALVNITLLFLVVATIIVGDRRRTVADRRAGELLRALLSPQEYRQLTRRDHVDIKSPRYPGRVYRVPRYPGRVQVRENGRATEWLCLQPSEWLPDADLVVIHKLMIEANEESYLQTANRRISNFF